MDKKVGDLMAMDSELTKKNEDLEEKVNSLMEKPTTTKVNCSINFQIVKLRLDFVEI